MPELSLAALQPAASSARVAPRAAAPRPERETSEPSTAATERRDTGRDNTPRELGSRRQAADRDESREPAREQTASAEAETSSARESASSTTAAGDENDTRDTLTGSPQPFAALLAAQLEVRPEEVPGVELAAIPAGVQQALAETPAVALLPGGNGLPPLALEEAMARHGATPTTTAPTAAAHAVERSVLAATQPGAAPATGEVASELLATDTWKKVVETLLTAGAKETPTPIPGGSEARASTPVFALASAAAGTPSAADPGPVTATVEVPFGQPRWAQAFGERVAWMVRDGGHLASLRLDPPHLGPVEVRVSVSKGEASMSFVSAHAPVREAIEAALPRLRELLGDQGLSLGNVDVSGRDARGESEARRGGEASPGTSPGGDDGFGGDNHEHTGTLTRARVLQGLLDHYA